MQVARDRTAVTLEQLYGRSPEGQRRLLVLNVCDGGRFEESGMVPRIGLAPALASPWQATISHLWPVLNFPSAAFGALLAHGLAQGMSFFSAYCEAMMLLRRTSPDVAAELTRRYRARFELTERLAQRADDMSQVQFSESAAFFQ